MMILEKCPTNDELQALSLGQLSEEESDELLGHLHGCETCQAEIGSTNPLDDTLVGQLREETENENPDESFSDEAECRDAMAKALGALAQANNHSIGDSELSNLLPRVLGEYEIVRPIGRGGMGSVYLARHSKLGRQVALKVLSSHRLMQPRMRQRFESEMRAVGQLSHPNIVTAHDAREVDEIAVLVTEYIDGLDIAQILRRTGKLSVGDACEIARQTALALQYVDDQGLVHRDIKPSNVMIGKAGEVKLLDLGLARLQLSDDERPEMTATGQAMGTADYIAPEQVNDSRQVDIRADIYALGCTLFKMLTGQPPFDDDRYPTVFAKMTAHVSDAPPSIESLEPEVPAELAKLVHRMIAKNANDRPQTPAEVAELLAKFSDWAELKQLVERAIDAGEIVGQPPRKPGATPMVLQTEPKPFLFRTVPLLVAIASGLLGILIGLALGIIITIKHHDGTTTQVEIPDGSSAKVAPNGDVEVDLKGASASIATPELSFLDQGKQLREKLQGVWWLSGGNKTGVAECIAFVDDRFYWIEKSDPKLHETSFKVRNSTIAVLEGGSEELLSVTFSSANGLNLHDKSTTAYYERISHSGITDQELRALRENPETAAFLDSEAKRRELRLANVASKTFGSDDDLDGGHERVIDKDRLQGVWLGTGGTDIGSNAGQMVLAFHEYEAISIINNEIVGVTKFGINHQGRFSTLVFTPPKGAPKSASMDAVIQFDGDDKLTMQTGQGKLSLKRIAGSPIGDEDLGRIKKDAETVLLLESLKKVAHYQKTGELQLSGAQLNAREAAMLSLSRNNLKQIGLALHNYHDAYKKFPASHIKGGSGDPTQLSWRVAILPFVEEQELYEKFRLTEPWDSEHNIKLLDEMPDVFRDPMAKGGATGTPYLAIVGDETAISESPVQFRDIRDGLANTIMVLETMKKVPWTKPDDLALIPEEAKTGKLVVDSFRIPELQPVYKSGFNVLFADGAIKQIKADTDAEDWKAFFTRAGGEPIKR